MSAPIIPQADFLPVQWGWLHGLLLITFPLHLLAMNAMLGGLAVAIVQHLHGGALQRRLAHRIAVALPLVIAFVVNFGVAPLLFLQTLYGQFIYTSSIVMGTWWILVIPLLITAYYGAYLYDFRFAWLGAAGPWIALAVFLLLVIIAFFFSTNMQLMTLPEHFSHILVERHGTLLLLDNPVFWPRFLHMLLGALAIGALFVGVLGRFSRSSENDLRLHAERLGLNTFALLTSANIVVGLWYLLSLLPTQRELFLGGNGAATLVFALALLLTATMLIGAYRRRFWPTVIHAVVVVVLMTLLRSWLRSSYLQDLFTLDRLPVVEQIAPMYGFFLILAGGLICIGWLVHKARNAFGDERQGHSAM